MYLGRLMEVAPREALYALPLHPYTQALISAVPSPDPDVEARRERIILTGDVPSPAKPPAGCVFHTRCPKAFDRCRTEVPVLRGVGEGRYAACHLVGDSREAA
jgi:oligopeptide/dipeptide ABC transporter ATP-binding protein